MCFTSVMYQCVFKGFKRVDSLTCQRSTGSRGQWCLTMLAWHAADHHAVARQGAASHHSCNTSTACHNMESLQLAECPQTMRGKVAQDSYSSCHTPIPISGFVSDKARHGSECDPHEHSCVTVADTTQRRRLLLLARHCPARRSLHHEDNSVMRCCDRSNACITRPGCGTFTIPPQPALCRAGSAERRLTLLHSAVVHVLHRCARRFLGKSLPVSTSRT